MKKVKTINNGLKADVAYITLVTDTLTGKTDATITPNDDILIEGSMIKVVGDEAVTGVFFVAGDGTETKVSRRLTQNDPSKVLARVPALAAGEYTLRVVTGYKKGVETLKNLRTLEYKKKLVVGNGGSDRPEIE